MIKKRNNLQKRARRLYSNARIEAWDSEIDPRTGMITAAFSIWTPFGWREIGPREKHIADTIVGMVHNWLVVVVARLETPDGEKYERSTEWLYRDIRINDMEELYKQQRAELLEPLNKHHLRDVGFIARTLSPEAVRRYLEKADELDTVAAIRI